MNINQSPIRLNSLRQFQDMNRAIYGTSNDVNNFDPQRMISRMHSYVGRAFKAVKKDRKDLLPYPLCMALSWSFALGNRLHRDIEDELFRSYPGACGYCEQAVCICKKLGQNRSVVRNRNLAPLIAKPNTLADFQRMLAQIYPENTLTDSADHLVQELCEIDEAADFFYGLHDPALFNEIIEEHMDVTANIFGVATCAGIHLAREMEKIYHNGCPVCHEIPCTKCGFSTSKGPAIR